jgi:hypothetical protein
MQAWILTFNRPRALNRQINSLGGFGYDVHIFSNHPEVIVDEDNKKYVKGILINTLADPDCYAWMARSWNSVYLKCFKTEEECIFVQDDTFLPPAVKDAIENNKDKYDLIWGPKGDCFYYMKKNVLREIGWWDERFLGAYCSDADFLLRCWLFYDRNRLSIAESHPWGFVHNDVGLIETIPDDWNSRCVDDSYVNQHHQIENSRTNDINYPLQHSSSLFVSKWGTSTMIDGRITDRISYPLYDEIDWYNWFTKKHLGK